MKNIAILLTVLLSGCTSRHFYTGSTLDEKIPSELLTFNIVNSETDNALSSSENLAIREELRNALQKKGMIYAPEAADLVVVYRYFEKKTKVLQQDYIYLPHDKVPNLSVRKTLPRSLVIQISSTGDHQVLWGAYATDLPKNLSSRQYKSVVNTLVGKLKHDHPAFAYMN